MGHYIQIFNRVILPISIVCVFGAIVQRFRNIEITSLAVVSLYILTPSLIFVVLTQLRFEGQNIIPILEFTLLQTALCWGTAFLFSKLFHLSSNERSALTLTTVFSNSGNYGLPVLLLINGNIGLAVGAVYVVGQTILSNSLGLYIASTSKVKPKQAMIQIFKMPLIYAILIGVLIHEMAWGVPFGVDSGLKILGNAYTAIVLLILGVQLGRVPWKGMRSGKVWLAILLRVVVVPILSVLSILILRIHGILGSILLVQSSMPAAVYNIVLSRIYDSDEDMVALTVAITTIISFLTLPILILLSAQV